MGLGCKSDTIKLNVAAISGLSITGVPGICEASVAYYEANNYSGFDYQWQLIPADAGAIKSGQGKNNVEIFWQRPGTHKVRVTSCAISADFNVTVWANPVPMVNAPAGLCLNDSALLSTTMPFSAYSWQLASGPALSSAASVNIPSGSYAVAVTDANGCKGSIDFNIAKYPNPNVSVSTAHPTGFCNNSNFVPISTVVPEGSMYSFAWLHDNAPFGGNTPVISTDQYGFYTVIATNEYGCTAMASPILLFNYCGGACSGYCPLPPHPPCPPGSMDVLPFATPRCDSMYLGFKDFTGQYIPGSGAWWTGISGGELVGTATGDNAGFVYPNAGKYIIVFKAQLQNGAICEIIDSVNVEAVALFSQRQACPGDSTLFVDESTRLLEAGISAWAWDFGETGSTDVSSLPSPGHPYTSAGNYTATLTITSATGCTATYSENVFVPDFPSPTFSPPLVNCAGNASAFTIANPAGIIKTEWDFGDPASGALNTSTGNTAYHNFSPAGNYPVTLTATNNYGCKGSVTQPVDIVPNPFSGFISPQFPIICEGKTIALVAPLATGASYVWSDASNAPTLTVGQEGVFSVTLTNGNGCTYSPPKKTVEVNPAPVGVIKALELNEFGQVIGVSYPTLSACFGEDVNLQVQDNGNYTFQWSGGNGSNETLIFSEDRGNLLPIGTHTYTVTLTNPATGCTAVLAPFTVTVNPVPSNFSLATNNVCAGTPSTITYTGPQPPNWDILWNTGETGPILNTEDAGLYFVRVVNEFGCSAQSNTVVIFPGPNIAALPSGCHERCNPDTLCLPPLPEIVSWQWYFEGNPIPGATSNQFAATQSGTYFAHLVDINGCQAQSADLTLELYDGYGNILGQVWSDVNNNGIIDAADTLVAFVPVQLWQNGAVVLSNVSGANGGFDWQNVLATGYTVQIDSLALDPHWEVVILADSVSLTGCGGKSFADLLVKAYACPPTFASIALSACPGDSALYNGTAIPTGQSMDFTITDAFGCDSIITVTVSALPTSDSTLAVRVCPGNAYTYAGVDLAIGQSQDFTLMNALGCDSIVTVTVSALPTSASTLAASVCPGSTYNYAGVDLAVGQTQDFTLMNALGCDSIVTVTVGALPTSAGAVTFGVCPNETFTFQGQSLAAGTVQDFTLTNALGCDSILTVTIVEKASSSNIIEVKVCPGESYIFNGQEVKIGETKDFHFSNSEGCDSLIIIKVTSWPSIQFDSEDQGTCPNHSQGSLTVNVAPGGPQPTGYSINGGAFQSDNRFSNLAAGVYTLAVQDENGCIVEGNATVLASPPLEVILHSDYMIPCDSTQITLTPILGGDTTGLQLNWWNGAHSLSTSTAEAGPVWLEATNHCGEQLHRAATVAWMSSDGIPINIFVPNIFAPSGKIAENTQFRPFFGNNFTLLDYRLEVYDRWGSLLFKSEQPENGWEGSFRDKMMEPGVYVWQLWVKLAFCGRELEVYKKGDVAVER
jgi:PKD repeat protein